MALASWQPPCRGLTFSERTETSVTSEFNVRNATGYEQLMGRWSQKLAPLFIDFAGLADILAMVPVTRPQVSPER